MSLAENRDEILDLVQEELGIVAGGYPVTEIGDTLESLSISFQAIGICHLLLTAEPAGLYRNLAWSACARRHFLRRASGPSLYHAISRTDALFDALVAGQDELARELIAAGPSEWVEDGEYEDDFAYFSLLHAIAEGSEEDVLRGRLARFQDARTDDTTVRYTVAQALVERDPSSFGEGLDDLLAKHEAHLEAMSPNVGDDPRFPARSAVFIEGLALLRLARAAGIAPDRELRLCPSSVLATRMSEPVDDIFGDIAAAGE